MKRLEWDSPEVALRTATTIIDRGLKLRGEADVRDKVEELSRGYEELETLIHMRGRHHA